MIAIMAVLGGIGIWGVNALTGRPAQQCAQKIVYSLERHRATAMGKAYTLYRLREGSDGKIYVDEYVSNDAPINPSSMTPSTSVEIGAAGVKLQYTVGGAPDQHDVTPGAPLDLAFERGSGSFKDLPGGGQCTSITASRGGRSFTVKLIPLTGKVYIE